MPYLAAQPTWIRYGLAILAALLAAAAISFLPLIKRTGHGDIVLFFFAIALVSNKLGPKPGLLTTALSAIGLNALTLAPDCQSDPPSALLLNLGFVVLAVTIVSICESQFKLIERLKESKQDLKLAQAVGQTGSWRLNLARNELFWSSETYRIFAVPEETALSYGTFLSFVHPQDRDFVDRMWQAALQGASYDIEHRIIVAGEVKWIHEKAILEFSDQGKLLGGFGITQDITARKQSALALEAREKQLQLIMDLTPALISYLDTDFRYVRINKNYKSWWGQDPTQIIGREVQEIVGEKTWAVIRPLLERARSGETVKFDHQSLVSKDTRWVAVTYIPDMDGAGTVKGIVVHVADITERKQIEHQIAQLNETLRLRVAELQTIFDTVPVGLAITENTEAKYIRGNPILEKILGLPANAELSLSNDTPPLLRIFQDGLELQAQDLPIQRAAKGERVINEILEIQRPDGSKIFELANASPLYGIDGTVRGAVGAFLDISDLNATQSALVASEERLKLAKAAGGLGIYDHDLVTNTIQWDERLRELWGLQADESITLEKFKACLPPEDFSLVKAAVLKSFNPECGSGYSVEYRVIRKTDQQLLWLAAYGTTTFVNGRPVRLTGFVQDISERKRAEMALRDTEARLALTLDELQAGYWDWDIKTNAVYLSPEWKRQLGYDKDELADRFEEWETRLHPSDRTDALELIANYINGEITIFELEFRLRHKDGSYRWIHSRATGIRDQNNRPVRILGIHLDITDFKKAKELDQQRKILQETSQLHIASQTAAAIAHELNQPLAAAGYFAEAAVNLLAQDSLDPNKLKQIVKTCSQQVYRAGKVIPQLLDLLYKGETVSEPVNINRALIDTQQIINTENLYDGLKLELNLDNRLPPVMANSVQIQKILLNIIHNGLESMLDNGIYSGKLAINTTRSPANPSKLLVSICDEGGGVSDDSQLKKIFQPFYTTRPNGLGMGLTISRSLIEAYGGEIWAEKNADTGITVNLTLPFM